MVLFALEGLRSRDLWQTSKPPKRLLKVSGTRIRLIDSSEYKVLSYITLSHCWGAGEQGKTPLTTSRDTYRHRCQDIPWTELPRTFQDAITLTRLIGCEFIWIDSLCIVQDDDDDWKEQSYQMADIYSHGYLNLAATAATDSSYGCFFARRHPSEPNGSTNIERSLSPRTLHFCASELVWECRASVFCECGGYNGAIPAVKQRFSNVLHQGCSQQAALDFWLSTVQSYSNLRLTKATDWPFALAGIASRLQNTIGGLYFAGIWATDLPRALAWELAASNTL
ncbi:uncharacterized protein K452DRAFT_328760 [Aplosporella prunicola CBS 121167]|uniref:Heterokaryon incompatibility domain-containing protein n=1 Tax=Aplosporella prunicola CBS 121167 TaxID=1176127 RepID=A0A6A6B317_9PEZI|nr:uncharacterized protein K452DRAFT_328760 [Aplosporella prunicola CBS 121167]KAF2138579.1 hypothetical protein K452DRAFT_328760 [Aplosporella prunicola CBS 121167]